MLSQTIDEKMREVVRFFDENKLPVSEILKRGRKQGLNEKQTLSGMAAVYERVTRGEKIKPNRLVWQAWNEGKQARSKDVMNFLFNRNDLIAKTKKMSKRFAVGYTVFIFAIIGSWLFFFLFIEYGLGIKLWQGQ